MTDPDVYRHVRIARDFLGLVVNPSLEALHRLRNEWVASPDPASAFGVQESTDLIYKTSMAFCLSIQSLWEQQIRGYLKECVQCKKLNYTIDKIENATWGRNLDDHFFKIRCMQLSSFDSYPSLHLLQLLGNACRHGDGNSARRLWNDYPDLWPSQEFYPFIDPAAPTPPSIQYVHISHSLLTEFVTAIVWFWEDIEYGHGESIAKKHWTLENKLVAIRETKTKRVKRAPINIKSGTVS